MWPSPAAPHVRWGETVLYRTTCFRSLSAKSLFDRKDPGNSIRAAEGQLRTLNNTGERGQASVQRHGVHSEGRDLGHAHSYIAGSARPRRGLDMGCSEPVYTVNGFDQLDNL